MSASASFAIRTRSGVPSGGPISSGGGLASDSTCWVPENSSSSARRASTSHSVFSLKCRQHRVAGNKVAQAVEIGLGHEVVEDVDHHAGMPVCAGRTGQADAWSGEAVGAVRRRSGQFTPEWHGAKGGRAAADPFSREAKSCNLQGNSVRSRTASTVFATMSRNWTLPLVDGSQPRPNKAIE